MSKSKDLKERRKYPRYYPSAENKPKVIFFLENGQQFSVDVVNISRGGMLASTPDMDYFLEMDHQKIKIIEIIPPNRSPFRCAGKILRIQPILQDRTCYCAVEFRKLDAKLMNTTIPPRKNVADEKKIPFKQWKEEIWHRVLDAENYLSAKNPIEAQQQVYQSFSDIAEHLTLEDRWWFFELLDEIKSLQPNIPDSLKNDFLSLCAAVYEKVNEKDKIRNMEIVRKKKNEDK